jgi:hypothetical protein
MASVKEKPKLLNNCDSKFVFWMDENRMLVPGDFRDDPMYKAWCAAWNRAYSTGLMRGQKQGRMHMQHLAEDRRKPMPYYEMEELFEHSKNGRDYGLKIEQWHGIGK